MALARRNSSRSSWSSHREPAYSDEECPVCGAASQDDRGFCSDRCRTAHTASIVASNLAGTSGHVDEVKNLALRMTRSFETRADWIGAGRGLMKAGSGVEFMLPAGEPSTWTTKQQQTVVDGFVRRAERAFAKNLQSHLAESARTIAVKAVQDFMARYGFDLSRAQAIALIAPRSPRWDEI